MKGVCTKSVFCDYCMKYVFAAISHSWYHTFFAVAVAVAVVVVVVVGFFFID